jgi:integrase/recombinase XerC
LIIPELKAAIDDYLSSREAKATAKSPLFTSTSNRSKGKRIAETTISTMIKEMLINAGYDSDRLTAHSLRHTSGTGAYKATGNIYLAQKHQRHASPETTEIYIHAEEREERQTEQQVYNYYFGAENKSKAAEAAELLQTLDEAKLDKVLEFINLIK